MSTAILTPRYLLFFVLASLKKYFNEKPCLGLKRENYASDIYIHFFKNNIHFPSLPK